MVTEYYQDTMPCQCDRMERTYYESGELEYETPFVNGVIHGKQLYYAPYEIFYGTYSGLQKKWSYKFETPYEYGILQGLGIGYYQNGIVSIEKQFENNECVYQRVFYPSGNIESEVAFKNDKEHGVMRIYQESGELAEEIPYEQGKIHGVRIIHHGKEILKDGWQIDGYSPYDYPDAPEGTITRITYSNGIRNGLETTHFADGTLMYEVEWKDGKRAGKGKTYNPDGTLLKESVYMYGDDIYGYTAVDTYVTGESTVDEALNHWFMPRGRENA